MAALAAGLTFFAPAFLTTFFALAFFLAGAFLALVDVLALVGMAHILPPCCCVRKIADITMNEFHVTVGTGMEV